MEKRDIHKLWDAKERENNINNNKLYICEWIYKEYFLIWFSEQSYI